jgi:diguanylate cyclase (GGDEF)-like protein
VTDPNEEDARAMIHHMASVFRTTNRTSDAVGRLGPNEFVLIAPETDKEGAQRLAERIRAAIEDLLRNDPHVRAGADPIRVRIGCYAVEDFSDASIDPVELLTRATLALRQSHTESSTGIYFYGRRPQVMN